MQEPQLRIHLKLGLDIGWVEREGWRRAEGSREGGPGGMTRARSESGVGMALRQLREGVQSGQWDDRKVRALGHGLEGERAGSWK